MAVKVTLDTEFCRQHFPAMDGNWVFMENAGGTFVPKQVIERANQYLTNYQVQPGAAYPASAEGTACVEAGVEVLASLINADANEIVVGPSTTSNVYVLSHALRSVMANGDEIIVTNQDHEANSGAWRHLEDTGIVVKEWKMNRDTDDLEIEDLVALFTDKTRLVCFTHCSNIVGLIHDVKAIVKKIHEAGAWACVDGVAFTPHHCVDVKELDVDFYLYSPYKVFGPHMGVLYGKYDLLVRTSNQNHFFVGDDDFIRKLCPGGPNYELTAAAVGIGEYFDEVHAHHFPRADIGQSERLRQVYDLISDHEDSVAHRVNDYLRSHPHIRLFGDEEAAKRARVSVFSFVIDRRDSREIPAKLLPYKIALGVGDFYAARCIDALGARPQNGVVRASMVHYNSHEDVDRLLAHLDEVIGQKTTTSDSISSAL